MPLSSAHFTTPKRNDRLEACLTTDSAHIQERKPPERGEHVSKIQEALFQLLPGVDFGSEVGNAEYGPKTAAAVLKYKTNHKPPIINRSYQDAPDRIVGRMTMQALDEDMAKRFPKPGPTPPPQPPKPGELVIEPPSDNFFLIAINPDNVNNDDLQTTGNKNNFTLGLLLIFKDLENKSTADLQADVKFELDMGAGVLGSRTAREFFNNSDTTGRMIKDRPPTDQLSLLVEREDAFKNTAEEFEKGLREVITQQVRQNFLNWKLFKDKVDPPGLSFGGIKNLFTNTTLATLIGSFQGSAVHIRSFVADRATRKFTSVLRYQFIDHFGANDSDATGSLPHGTDGQKALWFLQRFRHEKGGNFPFRHQVNMDRKFEGTF